MQKQIIRNRVKILLEKEKPQSDLILSHLISHPLFKKAQRIGLYYPDSHEVNTIPLIKYCLKTSKDVLLPEVVNDSLNFRQIHSLSDLKPSPFGILEPKDYCFSKHPFTMDLLIVPCVAIDTDGNRLGRGRGFYDRLIQSYPYLETLVFVHEEQIFDSLPTNKLDQKINNIVSVRGLIRTNPKQDTSKIINGAKLSEQTIESLKNRIFLENLKLKLTVILVGNNPQSELYISKKHESCKYAGINFQLIQLNKNVREEKIIDLIKNLNNEKTVTGILVQLPLPKHIDTQKVLNFIKRNKDVDGLTTANRSKDSLLQCCTPKAIMKVIEHNKIDLKNKIITILGYGYLVGKPLSSIFENMNIKINICTKETDNIKSITKKSDILICATGVAHLITKNDIKKNAVIIDSGTAKLNNRMVGDVNTSDVLSKVLKIAPAPGGVGPMTIAMLIENLIEASYLNTTHESHE